MSNVKNSLLSLFTELTPDRDSKSDIKVDDIDKAPLPKFPAEQKVQIVTTISKQLSSIPNSAPAPVTVSLSDANVQITARFGGGLQKSEYVSPQGVLLEHIKKATKEAANVPRSVSFEIFNRNHLNACDGLIQVFYYISIKNLQSAINYVKKNVNEELLNYCVNVVARHRPEFVDSGVQLPSHITSHPSTYLDVSKVDSLLYSREVTKDTTKITDPIEINSFHDFTATDADPEHFVAYFREDIGINLHHRHWHEVYPNTGIKEIVDLDRRGELFVYMHAQVLARYNFERLCNALTPVKKFSNFKEPIMEAYYPKLDEASEVKVWSPRQPFAQMQDVNRDGLVYEVADLERWLERLIDSIDRGYVKKKLDDGSEVQVKLEEPNAINDLGNTIDSVPSLSYNFDYYGDLHTTGHIILAYCHDPDKRFKELGGVMGKLEAALRDPIFYRWHAFIDDVMDRYKKKLRPYTFEERTFENVEIQSVEINSDQGEKNLIETFWQEDRVDVTDGILSLKEVDLKKRPSKVYVKFQHLQHKDFTYKLQVYNWGKATTGVVRIFMAPAKDETRSKMPFNKLRRFMIELDKFTCSLKMGRNDITRKSTCSSVTVPFEQTFMTMDKAKTYTNDPEKQKEISSYCGCGWPHHLLVGRGRENGYPCTLFVMITDYNVDKVQDSAIDSCGNSSISYCGVRNKKYPDKRPMGFPFDRPIKDPEADLNIFMTKSQMSHDVGEDKTPLKNMRQLEFKIKYTNKVEVGPTCTVSC